MGSAEEEKEDAADWEDGKVSMSGALPQAPPFNLPPLGEGLTKAKTV